MQLKNNINITKLMIAALGVVYGDIGTSPLYALKSCFILTDLSLTESNILGIISLFFWLLFIVVNIKYIFLVMRCEQQGEGGVLVLSSLLSKFNKFKKIITMLGIIAMALFVGDSIITPAISVLSAIEGLKLVTNLSQDKVILISFLVLIALFALQSKGSGSIGCYFGYIMIFWFVTIAILGVMQIIKTPRILVALNPYYGIRFLINNGIIAWATLGGAILVITGVEALYADMGHFGRRAINNSWIYFVFPALSLNYFGQGALLLGNAKAIENPFFLLAPEALIYPLTILSVAATIIASQAVISGLFSLTWQAIMLNYLPRMKVVHTSFNQRGQVYIPVVNYLICILSIIAVFIFKTSDSLAAAYGLSVASVMLITSILVSLLSFYQWKWSCKKILAVFVPLIFLDIIFVTTSIGKIFEGAWYTISIAIIFSYLMLVWLKGSKALTKFKDDERGDLKSFLKNYSDKTTVRIPSCAIFMTRTDDVVPFSLEVQLHHNKYLHEKIFFISIVTEEKPVVECEDKFTYKEILSNIYSVKARFGFYEEPSLINITNWAKSKGIMACDENVSVFLGRNIPFYSKGGSLDDFSEKLYIFLAKNSLPAYEFFKIDYEQVVELGSRYKI